MFKDHDIEFDKMAADSVRRSARITSLTKRRSIMVWCVMGSLVLAGAELLNGGKGAVNAVFMTPILWGVLINVESDLRLLRAIDWLQKGKDEKPPA
jgi:hypothetical protein